MLTKFAAMISRIIRIYIEKRVSRSAAELAYFLTLSLFPSLICLNAMLGKFFPNVQTTLDVLENIVPHDALTVLSDYFVYISKSNNNAMLTAGLILMATTSAAAYRSIHRAMGDIQGETRYKGLFTFLMSFTFSTVLLFAMYFAAAVVISGNWLLEFLAEHVSFIEVSTAWSWMRFILLFLIIYGTIYSIYRFTAPKKRETRSYPGAITASVVLVVVSMVFSSFISLSVRYPLVYGSLASVIIMMTWLYICGNIIILGNILNVVLAELGIAVPVEKPRTHKSIAEKKDSKLGDLKNKYYDE